MSEALARITRADAPGMISIRADLARAGDAIAVAVGLAIPDRTRITTDGSRSLGWMSPDELLVILPAHDCAEALAVLQDAMQGEHALIVDVSDMRVMFHVAGAKATQVLAKLCPVDIAAMPPDGFRRTRAAQVGVAIWRQDGGMRMVCFRSVADYVETILRNAAVPGSDLDPR